MFLMNKSWVLWILIIGKMAATGAKLSSVEFEVFGRVQGKPARHHDQNTTIEIYRLDTLLKLLRCPCPSSTVAKL